MLIPDLSRVLPVFHPSCFKLFHSKGNCFAHCSGYSWRNVLLPFLNSAMSHSSVILSSNLILTGNLSPMTTFSTMRASRIRLSAEQVRDQALAVSDLLSDKMYGPSVMPPQPEGVWQVIRNVLRWEESKGEDRYRRALYTFWRRSSPYPSFISFDSPSRELCVSRRINTNTPLQALTTLNDTVYVEAARALGQLMM